MINRFSFNSTPLKGLYRAEHKAFMDQRGFLSRIFCAEEFQEIGLIKSIAQINHSLTKRKGAVRGVHFQNPPYTETKIVTCIKGEVFDVAVDIRKGSSTYLQWHAEILSEENQRTLYVPDGFAHGFQTLAHNCEVLYCSTTKYMCESEGALNATDPRLNIQWPLSITERSDRDNAHPMITDLFEGVLL
jgi:dTDP-4-dehydrorhamnose 3,5-epimerase